MVGVLTIGPTSRFVKLLFGIAKTEFSDEAGIGLRGFSPWYPVQPGKSIRAQTARRLRAFAVAQYQIDIYVRANGDWPPVL